MRGGGEGSILGPVIFIIVVDDCKCQHFSEQMMTSFTFEVIPSMLMTFDITSNICWLYQTSETGTPIMDFTLTFTHLIFKVHWDKYEIFSISSLLSLWTIMSSTDKIAPSCFLIHDTWQRRSLEEVSNKINLQFLNQSVSLCKPFQLCDQPKHTKQNVNLQIFHGGP